MLPLGLIVVLQINFVVIVINAIDFFSRLTRLPILIAIKKIYIYFNQLTIFVSSDLS